MRNKTPLVKKMLRVHLKYLRPSSPLFTSEDFKIIHKIRFHIFPLFEHHNQSMKNQLHVLLAKECNI